MIIKFRMETESISSWGYRKAKEVYVHKKYSKEVLGMNSGYSFYQTQNHTQIDETGGNYPVFLIILMNDRSDVGNKTDYDVENIVIPVAGSEIYLLTDEGKTIERLK